MVTTTADTEDNSKDFEIIKNYINNKTVALDIGACIGRFTTFLSEHCKQVYAFEPSPSNFKHLIDNTINLSNVLYYNVAISDQNTDNAILYTCPDDIGMNRLYHSQWCLKGKTIHNISTVTIDSLLKTVLKLEKKIDFVKIDVEGYEYFVIMGMKQLLNRDHPIIMMEWHPPSIEESKGNPEHLHYLLKYTLGYNEPINCYTGNIITSYYELDKQTRNRPAVNLLFT